MIISAHNWLRDIDATADVDFATPADGYDNSNLWRGGLALAWRSAAAGTTHRFGFRLTTDRPVGIVALFDVRASAGEITSIEVRRSDDWDPIGVGTVVGSVGLNVRGDGALHLPVPIQSESWLVSVFTSEPALLTVGGIWLGEAIEPATQPSTITRGRASNAIVTVSEAATRRKTRLASPTRSFALEWAPMGEEESDEVAGVFDEIAAWNEPGVLVLDGEPYFGHWSDAMTSTLDPNRAPEGHALEFAEDGRALGA